MLRTTGVFLKAQAIAANVFLQRAEDFKACTHYFDADPVTGQRHNT
jgi:hypothetical protein